MKETYVLQSFCHAGVHLYWYNWTSISAVLFVYLSISVAAGQQLKLRFELESGNWRDESMEISPCTSTQPTISFFLEFSQPLG
jgi:hypothetical protein